MRFDLMSVRRQQIATWKVIWFKSILSYGTYKSLLKPQNLVRIDVSPN